MMAKAVNNVIDNQGGIAVVSEDFNLTQTLQDVINFVRKKSGSNSFSLLDGFPPRPITSYNKTIQELHLEGSLLTQKIN